MVQVAVQELGYELAQEKGPTRVDVGKIRHAWVAWGGLVAEKAITLDRQVSRVKAMWRLIPIWSVALGFAYLVALQPGSNLLIAIVLVMLAAVVTNMAIANATTFRSDLVRVTFWAELVPGETVYDERRQRAWHVSVDAGHALTHNWVAKHSHGRSFATFVPKGGDPLKVERVLRAMRDANERLPLP